MASDAAFVQIRDQYPTGILAPWLKNCPSPYYRVTVKLQVQCFCALVQDGRIIDEAVCLVPHPLHHLSSFHIPFHRFRPFRPPSISPVFIS